MAVKWFVPERDSKSAMELKTDYEAGSTDVQSPQLLLYEVANALRYHPTIKLSLQELADAVEALDGMAITSELSAEDWMKAFELAQTEDISVYDATYLSLAMNNDAIFLTADRGLFNKLSPSIRQFCRTL